MSRAQITIEELQAKTGEAVGVSQWRAVDQQRIDGFAELTEDPQWIHTDPARAAKESPFGTTIAHGFLSLSLLSPALLSSSPPLLPLLSFTMFHTPPTIMRAANREPMMIPAKANTPREPSLRF